MILTIVVLMAASAFGQGGATTFNGTLVIYGSGFNTRTVTRTFTMRLTGTTSGQDANRFLNILQERGQSGLLNAINDEEVGNFSIGGQVGRDINAAFVTRVDGRLRVRAIFERWIGFGELRGGYRSVDYPFSYIEIFVDPRTGRGEGTFFPAAQIRYRTRDGQPEVQIEDFGTFPARVMGVQMRGQLRS